MSYDGTGTKRSTVEVRNNPLAEKSAAKPEAQKPVEATAAPATWPKLTSGAPDFDRMTADQRTAYHQSRLTRMLG